MSPPNIKKKGANKPLDSCHLLDTLEEAKHIATALEEITTKYNDKLPKIVIKHLTTLSKSANYIHQQGQRQVVKVSPITNLLQSYAIRDKSNRQKEPPRPAHITVSDSMWRSTVYVKKCDKQNSTASSAAAKQSIPSPSAVVPSTSKKPRRSERVIVVSPGPDKDDKDNVVAKMLEGHGSKLWTKDTLCKAMYQLEGTGLVKKFVEAVLSSGKTDKMATTYPGITRMYNKWKIVGHVNDRGRPSVMQLDEAADAAKSVLNQCSHSSNNFHMKDMKKAFEDKIKEKAENDGLDPNGIDCRISKKTAKHYMTAISMQEDNTLALNDNKEIVKTESRYRAEHSIMMGYAYATTVLSTHFIEGTMPNHIRKHWKHDKLGEDAVETMEWMKEAMNADKIFPVNPNLVLSTDDTTLFVFEGSAEGNDDWEWKLVDQTKGNRSVRSDFQVGDDAENAGGLRVRLTFTFTAAGLAAPPYVAVSGLTEEELSPELCPDGILAAEVPGLCKGGNDLNNTGIGWLVFLRADKKGNKKDQDDEYLSIANKKFIHYNDKVLLPFIEAIRKKLGWIGGLIDEHLTCCSWFDGDIGQLQTMLYEAKEATDEALRIIRNKHSAAATGTQQPCDLSPVFRLLKKLQKITTAKDDVACGLAEVVHEYINVHLRAKGLNLDGNQRKKKAFIDFLLCLPENLEKVLTKKNISNSFVEAGMIDKETGMVPVFDKLMGTCKRWVSAKKNIGIPMAEKRHCRDQFQSLMKIQMENDAITYQDMKEVNIPLDIDSGGNPVEEDRPTGADVEHRQPSKTINGKAQKKARLEKRRRKLAEEHSKAITTRSTIQHILQRNAEVEAELKTKIMGEVIADGSVQDFFNLSVAQLKDFIHVRKFTGDVFHTTQLKGSNKSLNKVLFKGQTASSIQQNCSYDKPCFIWLAWMLRNDPIVLEIPPEPVLNLQVTMPKFNVVYAGPRESTPASEYLDNTVWVEGVKRSFKGVTFAPIDDELKKRADILATLLVARLDCHVSERVDSSRQDHWTIDFTRANITVMAAAMCLVGHVVDDIGSYKLHERLLQLPDWQDSTFQIMSDSNKRLEGCYLFYDVKKSKWVRSGKTSGEGDAACFEGRGKQHEKNAQSQDEMRHSKFYRTYPAREVAIDGVREGYFDNLQMYCAMAFDSSLTDGSLEPIYSHSDDGLFVWTDQAMLELTRVGEDLQKLQRDAVAYLWELCYDLSLANGENVSESPGFEGLGLRVNNKKRKSRE